MRKIFYPIIAGLFCLCLSGIRAHAFETVSAGVLCVNDDAAPGNDFQLALDEVERLDTEENTGAEVRLRGTAAGATYALPGGSHFHVATAHSLEISGGWNGSCSSMTGSSPGRTLLEGGVIQGEPGGVLSITVKDNATSTVTIENLSIANGSTSGSGGGLYFLHTATLVTAATVTVDLTDLIVENNEADTFGAGMQIWDNGTSGEMFVNITDCLVRNNTVTSAGTGPGGISVEVPLATGTKRAETYIANCEIINNTADRRGGGVYVDSGEAPTILVNNIVAGNSVADDAGGGVYIVNSDGGDITLTNNTITGNETMGATAGLQEGGGLFVHLDNSTSTLDIYNNIIFDNTAAGDGNDVYILRPEHNVIRINNNDLDDTPTLGFLIESGDNSNITTLDNLNVDPQFREAGNADPNDDDYHLQASSEAIDAGDNDAPELPDYDLDGLARILDELVDMGAFEFSSTPGGDGSDEDTGGKGCFIATAADSRLSGGLGPQRDGISVVLAPLKSAINYPLMAWFSCIPLCIFLIWGIFRKPEN